MLDCTADAVTEEALQRSILLSVCGATTYKLIRSIYSAEALGTTASADLVKSVQSHYDSKPSKIMQRHKFNTRVRAEGESITAYIRISRTSPL